MRSITVSLNDNSYPVIFGDGLCSSAAKIIKPLVRYDRVAVVCDKNTYPLYAADVARSFGITDDAVCVIDAGEKNKTAAAVERIYETFYKNSITRQSLIVTVGGGIVSDLGGYAAATYMRGVNTVHIPTTLLAMTDAAIGGKTGYNLPWGKNLVGAFHQPKAVICDYSTLCTLPKSFMTDGMAEVIKYALIRDAALFETLSGDDIPMRDVIFRCAQIKAEIVSADEKEGGRRKLLNFGHTIGHALETCGNFEKITHGVAVASGMAVEIKIGEKLGITPKGTSETAKRLLEKTGISLVSMESKADILRAIGSDKKRSGDQIDTVLLEGIGRASIYPLSLKKISELL